MTCTEQTDDDSWPPCTVLTHRLGYQTEQWEASENQHRTHSTDIWIHTLLVNKVGWQVTTTNTQYGYNSIESEDEGDTHT